MKFEEALTYAKKGHKIKLPSWEGYWVWDEEKQTIMMHCKPEQGDSGKGPVLDIRETDRVEYTLLNVCSDGWIIAIEENTPILGGISSFSYGKANDYILRGFKVRRLGWESYEEYITLVSPENDSSDTFFGIKMTESEKLLRWMPSLEDLISNDWVFIE